jgi:hypothetical protein
MFSEAILFLPGMLQDQETVDHSLEGKKLRE